MKNVIMNVQGKLHFLVLAIVFCTFEGCDGGSKSSSPSGGANFSPPTRSEAQKTNVNYQINLEDNKKVKEKGKKV